MGLPDQSHLRDTLYIHKNVRRRIEFIKSRGSKCQKCGFDNIKALKLYSKALDYTPRELLKSEDKHEYLVVLCCNCMAIHINRK